MKLHLLLDTHWKTHTTQLNSLMRQNQTFTILHFEMFYQQNETTGHSNLCYALGFRIENTYMDKTVHLLPEVHVVPPSQQEKELPFKHLLQSLTALFDQSCFPGSIECIFATSRGNGWVFTHVFV